MRITSLYFPFLLALFAHFFLPLIFPSIRFFAFAPFLAIVMMKKPLYFTLWLSALVGLIVDLTSSGMFFGSYTLSCLITTLLTFSKRRHFYEEAFFSLPVYTFFISLLWTLLFLVFGKYTFTFFSLISNLLLMPFFDALYAFFWFTCPLLVYNRLKSYS